MSFTLNPPKILIRFPEDREGSRQYIQGERAKVSDPQKLNQPYLSKYSTTEVLEQELTKVMIDWSAKKIRGSCKLIRRYYDVNTEELLEEKEENYCTHWAFDDNKIYIKE